MKIGFIIPSAFSLGHIKKMTYESRTTFRVFTVYPHECFCCRFESSRIRANDRGKFLSATNFLGQETCETNFVGTFICQIGKLGTSNFSTSRLSRACERSSDRALNASRTNLGLKKKRRAKRSIVLERKLHEHHFKREEKERKSLVLLY